MARIGMPTAGGCPGRSFRECFRDNLLEYPVFSPVKAIKKFTPKNTKGTKKKNAKDYQGRKR
jgi:hypothetical protein